MENQAYKNSIEKQWNAMTDDEKIQKMHTCIPCVLNKSVLLTASFNQLWDLWQGYFEIQFSDLL